MENVTDEILTNMASGFIQGVLAVLSGLPVWFWVLIGALALWKLMARQLR